MDLATPEMKPEPTPVPPSPSPPPRPHRSKLSSERKTHKTAPPPSKPPLPSDEPQQLVSEYEEFLKLVDTETVKSTDVSAELMEVDVAPDTAPPPAPPENDWDRDSSSPSIVISRKSSTSRTFEKASVSSERVPKKLSVKKKKGKKSVVKKGKKKKPPSSSDSDSSSSSSSDSSSQLKKKKRKKKKHVKKKLKEPVEASSSSSDSQPEDKKKAKSVKNTRKKSKEKDSTELLLRDLQLQKQEIARKLSELDALTDKKSKKAIARDLKNLEEKISKTHKVEGLVIPKKGKKVKKEERKKKSSSSSSSSADSEDRKKKDRKKIKKRKTKKKVSSSSESSDDEEKPRKKKPKKTSSKKEKKEAKTVKPKRKSSKEGLESFSDSKRFWRKRSADQELEGPVRRKQKVEEEEGSGWEDEQQPLPPIPTDVKKPAPVPKNPDESKLPHETRPKNKGGKSLPADVSSKDKPRWGDRDWEASSGGDAPSPSSEWENSKPKTTEKLTQPVRNQSNLSELPEVQTSKPAASQSAEVWAFKSVSALPQRALPAAEQSPSARLDIYSPGATDSDASASPEIDNHRNGVAISSAEVSQGSQAEISRLPFTLGSQSSVSGLDNESKDRHSSILDDSMFKQNSNFSEDIQMTAGNGTSFFHSTLDRPFMFPNDVPYPVEHSQLSSTIVALGTNGNQTVPAHEIYDPLAADSDMSVEEEGKPPLEPLPLPAGLDEIPLPAVPAVSEILLPGEIREAPPPTASVPLPSEPPPSQPPPPKCTVKKPPKPSAVVPPVKINRWDRPPRKGEPALMGAAPLPPCVPLQVPLPPTVPSAASPLLTPVMVNSPLMSPALVKSPLMSPAAVKSPLRSPAVVKSPLLFNSPTSSPSEKKVVSTPTTHIITVKMQQKLQSKVASVFQDDSDDETSRGLPGRTEIQQKLSEVKAVKVDSAPSSEKIETQNSSNVEINDEKRESQKDEAQIDATDAPFVKSGAHKREDRRSDSRGEERRHRDDRDRRSEKDRSERKDDKDRREERKDDRKEERNRKDDKKKEERPREKRKSRSPTPRRRDSKKVSRSPDRRDVKRRSRTPERRDVKRLSRTPERREKRYSRSPEKRDVRRHSRSPERRRRRSPSPRRRSPSLRRRSPSPRRRPRSPSPRKRRRPESPRRRR